MTTCGDGIRAGAEQCDDHNAITDDGCTDACVFQHVGEIEPNDDRMSARTNGPFPHGYIIDATMGAPADVDNYRFHVPVRSDIRIEVAGPDGFDAAGNATCGVLDIDMLVIDSTGAQVAKDDDGGPDFCPLIAPGNSNWARQVEPGDYDVRLRNVRPDIMPGYFLLITFLTTCGDGVVEGFEECESGPDCAACAFIPVCGNGRIEHGELCDDGNLDPDDGCTDMCVSYADHACAGTPSVCELVETRCGDGIDEPVEPDDDVDLADSDCFGASQMPACGPGESLRVFTHGAPTGLNDDDTTLSTLTLPPGTGTIRRVALKLALTHSDTSELDVTLASPADTTAAVSSFTPGQGFLNTTLDDTCATPLASGVYPFAGCYRPSGSFSTMAGEDGAGTWTLSIVDNRRRKVGDLPRWYLMLCTGS